MGAGSDDLGVDAIVATAVPQLYRIAARRIAALAPTENNARLARFSGGRSASPLQPRLSPKPSWRTPRPNPWRCRRHRTDRARADRDRTGKRRSVADEGVSGERRTPPRRIGGRDRAAGERAGIGDTGDLHQHQQRQHQRGSARRPSRPAPEQTSTEIRQVAMITRRP